MLKFAKKVADVNLHYIADEIEHLIDLAQDDPHFYVIALRGKASEFALESTFDGGKRITEEQAQEQLRIVLANRPTVKTEEDYDAANADLDEAIHNLRK